MSGHKPQDSHVLLVEPQAMLRRTVALTARSLGMAQIHEAASMTLARQILRQRPFDGAIIAIDDGGAVHDLALLDQVRSGDTASSPRMPIAVMADNCTGDQLAELKERQVARVIVKPFRARILLEALASLAQHKPG
ncbi:response regulator [Duganella sp. FT92W]|uniref:Response regulator n=1 Tax=Pseudoduganella rivuli TaxID=2666085 RepID=A0A7X2LUE3_9BURK|nr:response regulator [Pseudoduganella rivuli]MRV74311.1 response regulator [Pseudoduganella rivuli]